MTTPRKCIGCGKPSGDELRCQRCCWREAAPSRATADCTILWSRVIHQSIDKLIKDGYSAADAVERAVDAEIDARLKRTPGLLVAQPFIPVIKEERRPNQRRSSSNPMRQLAKLESGKREVKPRHTLATCAESSASSIDGTIPALSGLTTGDGMRETRHRLRGF